MHVANGFAGFWVGGGGGGAGMPDRYNDVTGFQSLHAAGECAEDCGLVQGDRDARLLPLRFPGMSENGHAT